MKIALTVLVIAAANAFAVWLAELVYRLRRDDARLRDNNSAYDW